VAALVVLLIVLTVLPYIAPAPEPILAAIVIHALARGLSLQPLGRYFIWRRDCLLVICAVGAVLLLGVLDGLLVAVAISVLLMLKQMSAADIQVLGRIDGGHDFVDLKRHPAAKAESGVLIVRPSEALFFANVERMLGAALHLIRHWQVPVHTVILRLEESPDLDGTRIEAMQAFFVRVHKEGKRLILARLKDSAQTALALLPEVEANGVMLSGLSVDGAVQQAFKPYA
jgi:MFS superfamily sulfate permease-like transporter